MHQLQNIKGASYFCFKSQHRTLLRWLQHTQETTAPLASTHTRHHYSVGFNTHKRQLLRWLQHTAQTARSKEHRALQQTNAQTTRITRNLVTLHNQKDHNNNHHAHSRHFPCQGQVQELCGHPPSLVCHRSRSYRSEFLALCTRNCIRLLCGQKLQTCLPSGQTPSE